ncbi:OmpA family protein [Lampropedia puyangensis]|nr:OmpA family protein [Lampropedia puyangensis]
MPSLLSTPPSSWLTLSPLALAATLLTACASSTGYDQIYQPPKYWDTPAAVPAPVAANAPNRTAVLSADVRYGWQPRYVTDHHIAALTNDIMQANAHGQLANTYEWAKARCMVNLAAYTYRETRTDGVTEYLYGTAGLYAHAANTGQTVALSTPQIPGYVRYNQNLWNELKRMEDSEGARCALPALACGSVALLGADYEFNQGYGQHYKHGQMMLDDYRSFANAAQSQIKACATPAAPPPPPVPQEPVMYTASAQALFAFDKSDLGSLRPDGKSVLDNIVRDIQGRFLTVQAIEIVGHTDRLGAEKYNQKLSRDRAVNVGTYVFQNLKDRFGNAEVTARGVASGSPVAQCPGKASNAVIACLAPNRRVEIKVTGQVLPFSQAPSIEGVSVQ